MKFFDTHCDTVIKVLDGTHLTSPLVREAILASLD